MFNIFILIICYNLFTNTLSFIYNPQNFTHKCGVSRVSNPSSASFMRPKSRTKTSRRRRPKTTTYTKNIPSYIQNPRVAHTHTRKMARFAVLKVHIKRLAILIRRVLCAAASACVCDTWKERWRQNNRAPGRVQRPRFRVSGRAVVVVIRWCLCTHRMSPLRWRPRQEGAARPNTPSASFCAQFGGVACLLLSIRFAWVCVCGREGEEEREWSIVIPRALNISMQTLHHIVTRSCTPREAKTRHGIVARRSKGILLLTHGWRIVGGRAGGLGVAVCRRLLNGWWFVYLCVQWIDMFVIAWLSQWYCLACQHVVYFVGHVSHHVIKFNGQTAFSRTIQIIIYV